MDGKAGENATAGLGPAVAAGASAATVRLLFLLDITGSMSEEVDACNCAMQGLVSLCSTDLQDYAGHISFAVVTFTEDDKRGCFTSLFESTSAEEAQAYMDEITLCVPPEAPQYHANGDDGPENHKAALARTTELDPSVPTIAFLITDAPPHTNQGASNISKTAMHELRYLADKHPPLSAADAKDFFKTFHQTALAHFGSNLILNCVVYNTRGMHTDQPCDTQLLFGCLAQLTGGMLMQPKSRDASTLAAGLISVVKALMHRLRGQPSDQQQQGADSGSNDGRLEGFKLIDLSRVHPERSSEAEPAGAVSYGDTDVLFNIAMERMVAVCGKRWIKRAIGMSAPTEQLQFVWRAARYISLCAKSAPSDATAAEQLAQTKSAELSKLAELRIQVLKALPADQRGHFSVSDADLRRLGEEAAAWAAAGGAAGSGAVSAISLATVAEALEDDAVWEDWLHSVMKLLLGYPSYVSLPLDVYGQPDFMDAWSAVLLGMGVDTISAAEFMQLIQDESSATGLTDKNQYNAFLVMPAQGDRLAELVFVVASGTQALDYITSVAMGGKGFLPNLHAGLTAACLTGLLTKPTALTDFQWSQIQQMAHALCLRRTNAAKSVTEQLLKGQANPEDNVSKFVLALLRLYDRQQAAKNAGTSAQAPAGDEEPERETETQLQAALGVVLQEWLGSLMQRFYGKQTPENNEKYCQSVLAYVRLDVVFDSSSGMFTAAGFDPLHQLHPLEVLDPSNQGAAVPESIKPDWQAAVLQKLLGEVPGTPAHPMIAQFVLGAGRLLALLFPADSPVASAAQSTQRASIRTNSDQNSSSAGSAVGPVARQLPGAVAALDSCWPKWRETALEALLLRFRTARYTCSAEGDNSTDAKVGGKVAWEPAPVSSPLTLTIGRLQEGHATDLKGYKQVRLQYIRQRMLKCAATLLVRNTEDPEQACSQLKKLNLRNAAAAEGEAGAGADAPVSSKFQEPASSTTGPTATLLNVSYTLQRTDVPALLGELGASFGFDQQAQQRSAQDSTGAGSTVSAAAGPFCNTGAVTPGILRMLVLGAWSTQGAQALKNSLLVQQLCMHYGADCEDLMSAMRAREVCCRQTGYNRHGHSASMPFPGPDGWSEEYAAARLAAIAGKPRRHEIRVKSAMEAMRKFTAIAAWAKEAGAGDAAKYAAVAAELMAVQDARRYEHVRQKLQTILGQEMP